MSDDKRKPWGKFYWGDWRRDARLRRCSYAARGLWIDVMCLMAHECDVYGVLTMNAEPLTATDLAGLLGGSPREIQRLLDDLASKGVYSVMGDTHIPEDVVALVGPDCPPGAIISRRMVRDKAKEEVDRTNGRGGGNPKLARNVDVGLTATPDLGLTPPDKAQSQRSESEIRKKERTPARGKPRAGLTAEELREFEEWYATYPLHVGRIEAERAFLKARKTASLEQLIAGVKRYVASITDPKFTAHPATWLNAGRWSDEAGPASANGFAVSQRRTPRSPPPPLPEGWDRDL